MTKKLLIGCLVSLVLLFAIEILLWLGASALSTDWRVDPLPSPPEYEVICGSSEGRLTLCPDRGPKYERVRPEIFYQQALGPRIITIGESFVYGLGLEASESWPAQLEQQLGAAKEAEVWAAQGSVPPPPLIQGILDGTANRGPI